MLNIVIEFLVTLTFTKLYLIFERPLILIHFDNIVFFLTQVGVKHSRGQFPRLFEQEIESLTSTVTIDEVRDSLFDMSPFKVSSVDGFHAKFFQSQ